MTEGERRLVLNVTLNRISEADFLAAFPVNPRRDPEFVLRALEVAVRERSSDDVECGLLLGFKFGLATNLAPVLCKLILEDWHTSHENIAMLLQKLRNPRSIDCLFQAALTRFPYLDYDDARALAVKCIWALHDVDTDAAREKVELLARNNDQVIRENALQRLGRG